MSYLVNPYMVVPVAVSYTLVWENTLGNTTEDMSAGDVIRAGNRFLTGHTVIGVTPAKITVALKNNGGQSGDLHVKLIASDSTVKTDFGSMDSDDLTASYANYDFPNPSASAVVADGDIIAVYYDNPNGIGVSLCSSCVEANVTEGYYNTINGFWVFRTNFMATMKVYRVS